MNRALKRMSFFFVFVSILALPSFAEAATRTWDGGGGDENWSTLANWSDDTLPTSADSVVFSATSTKNCHIDVNINVISFNLNSGYDGAVTADSGKTVTITGALTVAAGTLDLDAAGTTTLTGNFTLNSATFIGPSTLNVAAAWYHQSEP